MILLFVVFILMRVVQRSRMSSNDREYLDVRDPTRPAGLM